MRILFACLAGVGCALMGVRMAANLTRREAMLEAWLRVTERMHSYVSYLDEPLPELIERVAGGETAADRRLGDALHTAATRMRMNRALGFEQALDEPCALADLGLEDRAIIMNLVRELGKTARPQQLRILEGTGEALGRQGAQAREQTQRQRRLYLSLGSMGGIALFLCLI